MVISIEGKVRRRTKVGRGFFRVDKWHDCPFKVELSQSMINSSEVVEASEHLEIHCEQSDVRVFVHAAVNRKHFVLGELELDRPKVFRFSVLSVAGYEVVGKVSSKTG